MGAKCENILIPLDGSDAAECSLERAKAIVRAFRVRKVFVLRVLPPFGAKVMSIVRPGKLDGVAESAEKEARQYVTSVAAALNRDGMDVESAVVSAEPAKGILDFAREKSVDLIVMATRGCSGGWQQPYGIVARSVDRVVRTAQVPVLLVRPS